MKNDRPYRIAASFLAAMILGCTVTLSVRAADGEFPEIYGPSNIGTLENGAVTIEKNTNRPDESQNTAAVSPCITTFSGPSVFTWVGTVNPNTNLFSAGTAGASVPGCMYSATSDSSWLIVAPGVGPSVTYEIEENRSPNTLTGHIRVLGAGAVFTLTVNVHGDGAAFHLNDYLGDGTADHGDGTADLTVWRPSSGTWHVEKLGTSATTITQQWGLPGDKPVFGDFDGDGIADFTVWRPSNGTWYTLPSSNVSTPTTRQFGVVGDIPVPADYDGDGKTDIAVFRPTNQTWYILDSSTQTATTQQFGLSGDIPVPADYDNDGKTDIAVWRPSIGMWYFLGSRDGLVHSQQLGLSTDIPVVPASYYFGFFYVWRPSTGQFFSAAYGFPGILSDQLGLSGDIPLIVQGLYAVWRQTNGTWYVNSADNATAWGLNGDVVVGAPHTATQ